MKDAWRMCTNSVNMIVSDNIVTWCQLIFQFSAKITLKVIQDGLDSQQVTSLGQRLDVYHVHLLLLVSLVKETTHLGWVYNVPYTVSVMCNYNVVPYIVSV